MFDKFEMLNLEERKKIYEFTYSINYTVTLKEVKEFINTYYDLLGRSDYKRACGIEVLLTDILENISSKRIKNKISKFLSNTPGNVITFNPQKHNVIGYK